MVVVNVSGLVKLLLKLGVLAVRPGFTLVTCLADEIRARRDVLNTTGVEGSLVNTVGNH